MKKIKLVIILAILSANLVHAREFPLIYPSEAKKDAIHLIYGDASCLKEKDKAFTLDIDFSRAEIVEFDNSFNVEQSFGTINQYNESHGQDYVDNWPLNLSSMIESACIKMKSTLGIVVNGDQPSDYNIKLKIGQYDFGHFVFIGSVKDGGSITKGLMEIYDSSSRELVAVFDINYLRGKNVGYGNNDRMQQFGSYFAKELKKAIK